MGLRWILDPGLHDWFLPDYLRRKHGHGEPAPGSPPDGLPRARHLHGCPEGRGTWEEDSCRDVEEEDEGVLLNNIPNRRRSASRSDVRLRALRDHESLALEESSLRERPRWISMRLNQLTLIEASKVPLRLQVVPDEAHRTDRT